MENAKQKAIEKAYGANYNKLAKFIDRDGWLKWCDGCPINPVISDYDYNQKLIAHRPKSLAGIETNFNWISINSEEDLPKQLGDYYVLRNGKVVVATYVTFDRWVLSGNNYPKTTKTCSVTHYQPIVKPEKPIY